MSLKYYNNSILVDKQDDSNIKEIRLCIDLGEECGPTCTQ